MSLIVEDGTGLPNAESYVSVAQADAYFSATAVADWAAATLADREVALRRATAYMDARYSFRGERLRTVQALAWPRVGYGSSEVPENGLWPVRPVANACCELALIAVRGQPYYVAQNTSSTAEREQVTVGPISVKYAVTSAREGAVRFQFIDDMLRYVARNRRGSFILERAE